MIKKIILSIIALCLIWSHAAQANFFDGKQKYYTVKTEHFSIHFPQELGPVAEEMKTITEETYNRIVNRLEWQPWGRTHVVLSDKTEEANGLSLVLPYDYILLYVVPPEADSTLDDYKDYLRLLFTHEFTHIVHIDMHYRWATPGRYLFGKFDAPNGATPGWVREGLAVYEESELVPGFGRNNSAATDMYIRTAIYENKFPRIDQITGVSLQFPGTDGAYLFGGKFFDWLSDTYGEDRLYKFEKEYASGFWVFSLNNKARRVFGKSFYKLWEDFKAEETQKYDSQRAELTKQGLTEFEPVIQTNDTQGAFVPRPGTDGFAYYQTSFDDGNKIIIKPDAQSKELHLARNLFGQMSFSATGRYLAFASLGTLNPKTSYADVYYYDVTEKKLQRVADAEHTKTSMRAKDPDFSPADGGERWIVMVRNFQSTDQLEIFDVLEKKGYVITNEPKGTQLSNPRFSPNGQQIVVSRKDPDTGFRDIVIYSKTGQLLNRVTHDLTPDNHPVFSQDGTSLYFDSYRTGIANIFEYKIKLGTFVQLTNVLDGVFEPWPAPGGNSITVQRYASRSRSIQKFQFGAPRLTTASINALPPVQKTKSENVEAEVKEEKSADKKKTDEPKEYPSAFKDALSGFPFTLTPDITQPADAKKYHALPELLVPRYVMPSLLLYEGTWMAGAQIGRTDPLLRQAWIGFLNYRADAGFVGGGGTYVYSRYTPAFYLGGLRYAVDWGSVNGIEFFEERNQVYGGVTYPFGHQTLSLGYFYEHRSAFTDLAVNLINMEPYAGFRFEYGVSNFKRYVNSISPENGYSFKLGGEWTDSLFGSDGVNEEQAVHADLRGYLEMPWADHHVLAVRVGAGTVWGDQQQFGAYRLGGPFGEGPGAGYSTRLFPLRGLSGVTYGGDQVAIFSTEYRFPIATRANFGIGTWPIFVDKIYLALFADGGDIRYRTDSEELFSRFLLATGVEISGNFVIGYGLPLTGRMGYGIILTNRDRLGTLVDSITRQSLRNGSVYLQLGTMF